MKGNEIGKWIVDRASKNGTFLSLDLTASNLPAPALVIVIVPAPVPVLETRGGFETPWRRV